ncbi:MAG: hypothetical protein ACD_23C00057G0001, partial [uncultured bacterium]
MAHQPAARSPGSEAAQHGSIAIKSIAASDLPISANDQKGLKFLGPVAMGQSRPMTPQQYVQQKAVASG